MHAMDEARANSYRLPLTNDSGAGLAIIIKTYLDELKDDVSATTENKTKIKAQQKPHHKFPNLKEGGLSKNLQLAWSMWDGVYAAVQASGKDVIEQTLFAEVNVWLSKRK